VGGDQVSVAASSAVSVGVGAGLHEVLTGSMAKRYGTLPLIPLPQEEDLLTRFIQQMGAILSDKGIYRRDTVIMLPDVKIARLNIMEAEVFCSWAQEYVVNYKIRYDKNGEPFTTYKDMPTEIAKKTILSPRFREYVPEIEEVFPIPLPGDAEGGGLKLLEPGFEEGKFVFKFK
jgi:hypothetical protein